MDGVFLVLLMIKVGVLMIVFLWLVEIKIILLLLFIKCFFIIGFFFYKGVVVVRDLCFGKFILL